MIFRRAFFAAIGLILTVGCSVDPPSIVIQSPEDNSIVSGVVTIDCQISYYTKHQPSFTKQFFVDDSLHQEGNRTDYEWDTQDFPDSSDHIIVAVLHDDEGNTDADTIQLRIIRQEGEAIWSYYVGAEVSIPPAVGLDGTIYVGSADGNLYAFNPDGSLKWSYDCGHGTGTVALGPYCDIYVAGNDSCLYALSYLSGYRWHFQEENTLISTHALAADGTIYIAGSNQPYLYLYALNSDGSIKWCTQLDDWTGNRLQWACIPSIGPDGNIYVGACNTYLYAIDPDGNILWRYKTGDEIHSSPSFGDDGTIYFGANDHYLYALNPDSTLRWRFGTGDKVTSSPSIGPDGTIYVGSADGRLYAINPDGSEEWSYPTGDIIWASSAAISEDGTIYFGALDKYLYAINPDGTLKWRHSAEGGLVYSSPAIASNGTVYFGSTNGTFYAIRGSSPLASDAPWPMHRHDLKRTGRAGTQ